MIKFFQDGGRLAPRSYYTFVSRLFPALKQQALDSGMSEADSTLWATHATEQAAYESGYGSNAQSKNYNYGGLASGQNYRTPAGYAKVYYDMLKKKWPKSLQAKNITDYVHRLHENNGYGIYSTTPVDTYIKGVMGVRDRVLDNIARLKPQPPIDRNAVKFNTPIVEQPDATYVDKPDVNMLNTPKFEKYFK